MSRERAEAGKGDDEEGAADLFLRRRSRRKGAVDPVSEKRGQEEKGEVATQVCSMSADVFLRNTAVNLMKRSSSHPPCGLGPESPNLSAAPSTWQHAATQDFTMLQSL